MDNYILWFRQIQFEADAREAFLHGAMDNLAHIQSQLRSDNLEIQNLGIEQLGSGEEKTYYNNLVIHLVLSLFAILEVGKSQQTLAH